MKMLLWVIANWDSIAVVLVALIGLIVYIRKNGIKAINEMAFAWYTDVEAKYGGDTGILKRSEVSALIYEKLPTILKLLLPASTISKLLEKGLKEAKEVWSKNDKIAAVASGAVLVLEDTATEM